MPTCEKCKGKKNVIAMTDMGFGIETSCPECKGTGEVGNPDACPRCNDSKTVILSADKSPMGIAMEVDCPECSSLEIL